MNTLKKLMLSALFLGVLTPALRAQNYSVDWFKIAGGGGASSNSEYSISGAIGQLDASGPMTGGNFQVTGGFWSFLSVVQTPGAPLLAISYTANQAVISWPSGSSGWTLQTNINLSNTNWENYTGPVVNNSVTSAPPKGNVFFRLVKP